MKNLHRFAFPAFATVLLSAASVLRGDDQTPATTAAPATEAWTPPADPAAYGLLPADPVLPGGHHKLLERWTKAFGLSPEQQRWIEPQLHAEEALTKPVLGYKALNEDERKQILLTIKLAARRQIRVLLTPEQQKLMDQEIESTKATDSGKSKDSKKESGAGVSTSP